MNLPPGPPGWSDCHWGGTAPGDKRLGQKDGDPGWIDCEGGGVTVTGVERPPGIRDWDGRMVTPGGVIVTGVG